MTNPSPEALARLRAFIEKHVVGGCKILLMGEGCMCPLCDLDRLAELVRTLPPATAETDGVDEMDERVRAHGDFADSLTPAPPSGTPHRCSGCGLRWQGPSHGAELCGDCWRRAQPALHASSGTPTLEQREPVGVESTGRKRYHRTEKELRGVLSMLCNYIWTKQLRPGEHMWSIPVDQQRDFDCILSDAIDELVELRARLSAAPAEETPR